MATITDLSLLFFFTLYLSVHAKLNLDTADHHAIFTILEHLGVSGDLPCPDNLCNAAGIYCEPRISKESHVLKVTRIVFKSQRLRGFLSPAIGQLSELKELSFPNNYLVDHIPPQITHCHKLEVLDVGNNKLSGEIPSELSSLFRLRILNFSSNMFTGNLSFLNYLSNLEQLSLDNNMFTMSVLKKRNYELVPRRYMLAELTDSSTNENIANESYCSNSPQSLAPVPSSMEIPNNKHKQNKKHNLRGILFAWIGIPTTFLVCYWILSTREDDWFLFIYSPLISEKELEFLKDHEKVAALQVIGRGGCGEVYKRELQKGKFKAFAIKKITKENFYSKFMITKWDQVNSERRTVGKIRHRNLLPLLACAFKSATYLVYEFMQNGSLHDIIKQVNNGTRELNWPSRHKISIGIASGLEFLHMTHRPRIVHRDLKPANVLLDDDMEALITDFGLAQSILDNEKDVNSSCLAGTFGYMAPEYHQTMRFDEKCDIYSFGVLLAVLVMGKFPSDEFFQNTSEMSMVRWIRMVLSSDDPKQAIDPTLLGSGYEEQILLVLKIACSCTLDKPDERPNSTDCRLMLTQIIS